MINKDGYPPLYVIDGHNTFGVSGGPVWGYFDNSGEIELAGVIVRYAAESSGNLPGFVFATPIHPLITYLESLGSKK